MKREPDANILSQAAQAVGQAGAQAGGNSASIASAAFASRNVTAILTAVQDGHIQSTDHRLAAFARANPSIAANTPLLAALLPPEPAAEKRQEVAPTTQQAEKPAEVAPAPAPKTVKTTTATAPVKQATSQHVAKPPKVLNTKETPIAKAVKELLGNTGGISGGTTVSGPDLKDTSRDLAALAVKKITR